MEQTITLSAALIGTTEFVKRVCAKFGFQVTDWITFVVAVALGVLFSAVNNGNLFQGAVAGATAAGFHTFGSVLGKNNK